MNRREMLAGLAAVPIVIAGPEQSGVPAGKASDVLGIAQYSDTPLWHVIDPAERKKQYAICRERGHVAAPEMFVATGTYGPADLNRPQWSTCKYCGTGFRFVTTMEENNPPDKESK